jgi:hypothetical protein
MAQGHRRISGLERRELHGRLDVNERQLVMASRFFGANEPDVDGLRAEVYALVERALSLDLPRLPGVLAEAQAFVTARLATPPSPQPAARGTREPRHPT